MNRFFQLIGILTCLVLPIYFGAQLYDSYTHLIDTVLKILGFLFLILTVGYLAIRAVFGKNWLIKGGALAALGGDLIQAIQKLLEELPKPKRETIAAVGGHLFYRFTRLGLIGLMLAIIPIWLLWQQNVMFKQQNVKIERQNDLINTQNTRIDQQTNLIEADRRSSLIFLMSNIMDKVDQEVRQQKLQLREKKVPEKQINTTRFSLSQPLIGRIAALSQAFKPYRYLSGDTLISSSLSPERGQLLIALAKSNLDHLTLENVYRNTTFENAHLITANLSGANLSRVKLVDANLGRADLSRADLSRADLRNAYLVNTDLSGANLGRADLREADLEGAGLIDADLIGAHLRGACLSRAVLRGIDLSRAVLEEVDLRRAILEEADLSRAFLSGARLSGARLSGADLNDSDLSGARLNEARLNGAHLSGADLSEADLSFAELENVKWLRVIGLDTLTVKNITAKQLLQTRSLKGSRKGLPQTIIDSILMIKPELFEK